MLALAKQLQRERLNLEIRRQSYINSVVGYDPIKPIQTTGNGKTDHSRLVMKRAHHLFVYVNLASTARLPFRACLKKAWREYNEARGIATAGSQHDACFFSTRRFR